MNKIVLSQQAEDAIIGLRHNCGTFDFYSSCLNRISSLILHASDELGMSSNEALSHLRALDAIHADLSAIAEKPRFTSNIIENECDESA